jgi:hypothetical protein
VGTEGKHLRMVVTGAGGKRMTLIAFSVPEKWLKIPVGQMISVTVKLMKNEWNGRTFVEGRILDIRGI